MDYQLVNGKSRLSRRHPTESHLGRTDLQEPIVLYTLSISGLGVPDVSMRTCRRIETRVGPVYREGGFYFEDNGQNKLCQLKQVKNE